MPQSVSVGRSDARVPEVAVAEAASGLMTGPAGFVLAFVPNRLDVDETARALERWFGDTPVLGCSTAGQITPQGYEADALLLMAFPAAQFRCSAMLLAPLAGLSTTDIATRAQVHVRAFPHRAGWHRLGLIFSDGLSKQEDVLISALETVLDGLPIFGGSAGDGLDFGQTFVLHGGRAHRNAAVLVSIETSLDFQGLGFDHFLSRETPVVITDADAEERLVYEINGAPAALEYARLVGCDVADLSPTVFAENPLLLEHSSAHYVRAISDSNADHALSFMAAIDDGLIMTLGKGREIIETLIAGLEVRDRHGREPDFILGFDCVLRRLETEQKGIDQEVSDILRARRVIGFNTYGEQKSGVHMNQTFVGVAFYPTETEARS